MIPEVQEDRHMQALTGLSNEKLTILEEAFSETCQEKKQQAYQEGFVETKKASCQPRTISLPLLQPLLLHL
jgi:hypothetical protein